MRRETAELQKAILRHVRYSLGRAPDALDAGSLFQAAALAVRDRLVDAMLATERRVQAADAKRVYYLSLEFLIGRSLENALQNLGLLGPGREVMAAFGTDLEEVFAAESDAALGNGGLGRLAACFLDSMASLDLPGFGYGLLYEFGLFRQEIDNGHQREHADRWRSFGSPWVLPRPDEACIVPAYGRVERAVDVHGRETSLWLDWRAFVGVPHDVPIVGYGGRTVNWLRLFAARAPEDFHMGAFNGGDHLRAVQEQLAAETLTKVLYPADDVAAGRELRLLQEYFLVACALKDVIRRYRSGHPDFSDLPSRAAIQLNDTHPALAVVELMRMLVDEHAVPWDEAWQITEATCAYTNHTLMPEALERWPVPLLARVLPRHLEILYEINARFLQEVAARWPGDTDRLRRMSIIEESQPQQARMAHLAIVGSHAVNGVAAIHSELVKTDLVPDFHALWPGKFSNKTNGVTPRRWLLTANAELARLITAAIGDGWVMDLEQLAALEPHAEDPGFRAEVLAAKRRNKERLARLIREKTRVAVDPASCFDVQVKRIHEYKRQLLNVLHIAHQYLALVEDGVTPAVPKTYVFAGKAAPGYHAAKQIVRLIHGVAGTINADPRTDGWLRAVFVPDYRVSLAEVIIPAGDLSEQISLAGTEASGTSNMKFALNGALTIGTLDGATIEIREAVGPEQLFVFGLTAAQVRDHRARGTYRPRDCYESDPALRRVLDALAADRFSPTNAGAFAWVRHALVDGNDPYFHLADFGDYRAAHERAALEFRRPEGWARKAIRTVARMGRFSSDRTVGEYAREIWGVKALPPQEGA
jgi:starch phosphorylase